MVPQVRGRFAVHRISADEAKFKLCRVKEVAKGAKGIPYMNTHDGRTIRYPDPQIGAMDTIKLDLETGKVRRGPTLTLTLTLTHTAPGCPAARPPLFSPELARYGSSVAPTQPSVAAAAPRAATCRGATRPHPSRLRAPDD